MLWWSTDRQGRLTSFQEQYLANNSSASLHGTQWWWVSHRSWSSVSLLNQRICARLCMVDIFRINTVIHSLVTVSFMLVSWMIHHAVLSFSYPLSRCRPSWFILYFVFFLNSEYMHAFLFLNLGLIFIFSFFYVSVLNCVRLSYFSLSFSLFILRLCILYSCLYFDLFLLQQSAL